MRELSASSEELLLWETTPAQLTFVWLMGGLSSLRGVSGGQACFDDRTWAAVAEFLRPELLCGFSCPGCWLEACILFLARSVSLVSGGAGGGVRGL